MPTSIISLIGLQAEQEALAEIGLVSLVGIGAPPPEIERKADSADGDSHDNHCQRTGFYLR